MNGISLFANVGIDELFFKKANINIVLSNELLQKRADFYKEIYPNVEMICGDITNDEIFNLLVKKAILKKCEFLIVTPPCQGMSLAGKRKKR